LVHCTHLFETIYHRRPSPTLSAFLQNTFGSFTMGFSNVQHACKSERGLEQLNAHAPSFNENQEHFVFEITCR